MTHFRWSCGATERGSVLTAVVIVCGLDLLFPSAGPVRADSSSAGVAKPAGGGKKQAEPGAVKMSEREKLSEREKRMLRWHMKFSASNGPEYLAQLHGLGAILAIPVTEEKGKDLIYKVIRDLRPGKGVLKDDDLSKIQPTVRSCFGRFHEWSAVVI